MNNNAKRLRELSSMIIFEDEASPSSFTLIDELFRLFTDASGCNYEDEALRRNIQLPEGRAIGTSWAGLCVKEIFRTQRFLQGIYQAILSAKEIFPEEPLQILYAGTGPFATLAIPFTTLFQPEELQFTFLEINPESYHMQHKVIEFFDCAAYIAASELCDATKYCPPSGKRFHIIISETMQQALVKEPQVSITLNLLPFLAEEGILIPENIHVDCVVMNMKKQQERLLYPNCAEEYYENLGTAFELNNNINNELPSDTPFQKINFPVRYFQLPDHLELNYSKVYLVTKITVFRDIFLTDNQCSLTLPYRLKFTNDQLTPGKCFGLQYIISDNPHYTYVTAE